LDIFIQILSIEITARRSMSSAHDLFFLDLFDFSTFSNKLF